MLVAVNTSKHHLLSVGIFLPHHVRCLLKNRMKHLTEPTPVGVEVGRAGRQRKVVVVGRWC